MNNPDPDGPAGGNSPKDTGWDDLPAAVKGFCFLSGLLALLVGLAVGIYLTFS